MTTSCTPVGFPTARAHPLGACVCSRPALEFKAPASPLVAAIAPFRTGRPASMIRGRQWSAGEGVPGLPARTVLAVRREITYVR